MRLAILESPYAGDVERNLKYASACMKEMLVVHNEAPYASHLLYTREGVLNDNDPKERKAGIEAGFEWKQVPNSVTVFYIDLGFSSGMEEALELCVEKGLPFEVRKLRNFYKIMGE